MKKIEKRLVQIFFLIIAFLGYMISVELFDSYNVFNWPLEAQRNFLCFEIAVLLVFIVLKLTTSHHDTTF